MTSPWTPPATPFPGPHPTGQLVVHIRPPLGGVAPLMTPVLTIDGYPAPVQWGRNTFVAPVGPRHLRASTRYLWDYGRAEQVVPVQPHRPTEVHYSGPALTFLSGRMGPVLQPRPGTAGFWILMGVLMLALLLGVAALVIGLALSS